MRIFCFPVPPHADAHAVSNALVLSVLPLPDAPSLVMSHVPPSHDAAAAPSFAAGASLAACAAHTSATRRRPLTIAPLARVL
nr:unnamed protein product [Digitaria exilis]